ncbi:hypothetical protein [Nonomuraea cavernae]|uniref:DUF2867 domain-containing protein n=1 Tax=Nonomuraea cavernae TaxID=2045107 RepID=A0A917YQV3_9ACTN|nr:hypothetical protein [Nonomuraea cavernae]MCA2184557.1 hypothetical protein [Nonomuraea cavernae]GGO63430.1 hypothetical protein GCM10012289_10470 [Nonomuraea cavernae]
MRPSHAPHLDEHAIFITADRDDVWRAMLETVERIFSRPHAAGYARLVRCADRAASGPRPLAVGSAVPGFLVTAADPGIALVLEGRHRFSSYALIFRMEPAGTGRTRLRAETRAVFPGVAGGAYRLLLFGTGGHVAGVRSLLRAIAARSGTPA